MHLYSEWTTYIILSEFLYKIIIISVKKSATRDEKKDEAFHKYYRMW